MRFAAADGFGEVRGPWFDVASALRRESPWYRRFAEFDAGRPCGAMISCSLRRLVF